ncbi:MAG: alpha/beta hydrolase family protein [Phycisphaerales bacterium JB050]
MTRPHRLLVLGLLLLGLPLASAAVMAPPQTPEAPTPAPDPTPFPTDLTEGPYEVGIAEEIRFSREGRDMPLPLKVRYPIPADDETGPFPLVVLSHGMGGYTDAFEHLSRHLASHGYVVIHPGHTDSIRLRREAGESAESLRNTFNRGAANTVDLRSRINDCIWIVEHLGEIEMQLERPGLIDREHRAMAGHSAGAMTTQALAGLKFQTPRGRFSRSMADGSMFDAYVVISGQGTTYRSLTETSWTDMTKPMLVFSGTEDGGGRVSSETPESRRHPYEYAPDGDKYLIHIEGATHASYQGGDAPNADQQRIEALTSHATLAFLEAYLRNHGSAKAWLANSDAKKFLGVTAEYHSK